MCSSTESMCLVITMQVIVSWNEAFPFHESLYSALYTAESSYQLMHLRCCNWNKTNLNVKKRHRFDWLIDCLWERTRVDTPVRKAGSVVGCKLDSLEAVAEGRIGDKIKSILHNPSHPLHDELWLRRSTYRFSSYPIIRAFILSFSYLLLYFIVDGVAAFGTQNNDTGSVLCFYCCSNNMNFPLGI